MEEPICTVSIDGDEIAVRRSVVENIFRAITDHALQEALDVQSGNRRKVTKAGVSETAASVEAPSGGGAPAEKIAVLEKVSRSLQLGMADIDMSGLYTHGRVRVTPRSAEILEFTSPNKSAKDT
jgi:hypothetical protein